MARRQAARAGRVMRVARSLWPDGNPLRRAVDRAEAAIVAALMVAFLAVAPMAAGVAGHIAYGEGVRAAQAERAGWHQARAVLLARAVTAGYGWRAEAPAAWTAPDGAKRAGLVPAPPGARAGSTVEMWTDAAGRLTGAPLSPAQVRGQEVLAAVLAPVALGLVLLGAWALAHWLLGRRRLAAWDEEWRATGPQWSRLR